MQREGQVVKLDLHQDDSRWDRGQGCCLDAAAGVEAMSPGHGMPELGDALHDPADRLLATFDRPSEESAR